VTGAAVAELAGQVGTARACALLGRSRATHYRQVQAAVTGPVHGPARPRASPANALTPAERDRILQLLTSEQYRDKSVAQTWVTLLDDGTYLASMSTMRRVLREAGLAGERRAQATHPARARPELLATGPGQVWSWDFERHEAFLNRAVMEGHRRRSVAADRS